MSSEPITIIRSRAVFLDQANIDTDQIIPARFLLTTGREGLGRHAFHDWRYDTDGNPNPSEPLSQADHGEHRILVTGPNFGCGSSREHAVWALQQLGIQAVISPSLADIFRSNALKNGLLAIELAQDGVDSLRRVDGAITIDLPCQTVTAAPGGKSFEFEIDTFSKRCLIEGTDAMGLLLAAESEILAFEEPPC